MKRKISYFLFSFIFILFSLTNYSASINTANAQAITCQLNPEVSATNNDKSINLTITSSDIANGRELKAKIENVWIHTPGTFGRWDETIVVKKFENGKVTFENVDGEATIRTDGNQINWHNGEWSIFLYDKNEKLLCNVDGKIHVAKVEEDGRDHCSIDFGLNEKSDPTPEDNIIVRVNFSDDFPGNHLYPVRVYSGNNIVDGLSLPVSKQDLNKGYTLPQKLSSGDYQIEVRERVRECPGRNVCRDEGWRCTAGGTFSIDSAEDGGGKFGCLDNKRCIGNIGGPYCIPDNTGGNLHCGWYPPNTITNPCQPRSGEAIPSSCKTAIGKIAIDPEGFMKSVLILVLSLGGGILLVFLIVNGYKLMISQGDPEKIKEARESIVSAVVGLLFIIFSIAILQLITVDILGLPGFR